MAQIDIATPMSTEVRSGARSNTAWTALVLLAITICSGVAMRTVFSPVQELVARDLRFSDFQVSLIQGLALSIPVALLSIPIGRMTDRGNRARLLFGLSLLWTIGSFGTVFAVDFWQMFGARMFAGIGSMCAITVAISMAADMSAPHMRGRSLLLLSLGNLVGAALAFALGGALLGHFANVAPPLPGLAPWRSVHLAFSGVSLLLTLLLLTIREPERHEISDASPDIRTALRALWQRRGLIAPLFLGQVTVVMADAAATIWAAPVLSRSYGLQPEQFAGWIGLVLLASGIVGSILGGLSADAGQKSKIKGGILLGAVIAAIVSIPAAFFPLMPTTVGFALMLFLLMTCGAITGLVTAAALSVLVPNEIRGVCLGAFIVVGAIIGFGVAPTLTTLIADAFGGPHALRYGLTATSVGVSIISALGFIGALRSAKHTA